MITVSLYCFDRRLHKLTEAVFGGPSLAVVELPAVPRVGELIRLSRFQFRVASVEWSSNLDMNESDHHPGFRFDQVRVTCDWVKTERTA